MTLITDGLLIAAACFAGAYCFVLSRRVRALMDLESGVGGAIVRMTAALEEARRALEEAKAQGREGQRDLREIVQRGEAAAGQLRLLLAATRIPPAPPPARAAAAAAPDAPAAGRPAPQPDPQPAPQPEEAPFVPLATLRAQRAAPAAETRAGEPVLRAALPETRPEARRALRPGTRPGAPIPQDLPAAPPAAPPDGEPLRAAPAKPARPRRP